MLFVELTLSLDRTLDEILVKCDESGETTLQSARWLAGWEKPLHKVFLRSLPAAGDAGDALTRVVTLLFTQVEAQVKIDFGPVAYTAFERALCAQMDIEESGESIKRLQEFGVPNKTTFEKYLPALELCISTAQAMTGVHRPSHDRVMDIARSSIRNQFPHLMNFLFAGEKRTTDKPYAHVTAMLSAFKEYGTDLQEAINGDMYFSPPVLRGSTLKPAPLAQRGHHTFSRQYVANVSRAADEADPEPTQNQYPDWPLDRKDFAEVMHISSNFGTKVTPLWNPLLTIENRSQVARENKGFCLNCGGSDCSVRTCQAGFVNHSNTLNPAIAQLSNRDEVFGWQARLTSYKKSNKGKSLANAHSRHGQRGRSNSQRPAGPTSTALTIPRQDARQQQPAASATSFRG